MTTNVNDRGRTDTPAALFVPPGDVDAWFAAVAYETEPLDGTDSVVIGGRTGLNGDIGSPGEPLVAFCNGDDDGRIVSSALHGNV